MTGLTVFYTIHDVDTGEAEAYAASLAVLAIPASGELRVHFRRHRPSRSSAFNPNSIYLTSEAAKHVTVSVQAEGF